MGGDGPTDHSDRIGLVEACASEGSAGLVWSEVAVLGGDTGEVEEVGVLVEGIEDGAGAVLEIAGSKDGDAASRQLVGKGSAAVVVFESRDTRSDWRGSARAGQREHTACIRSPAWMRWGWVSCSG